MKISSLQNKRYTQNNLQKNQTVPQHKTKSYNKDVVSFNGIKWKNPLKWLKNFFSMPDINISFNKQDIKDIQKGIDDQLYKK